jgi:hypothetical protein
MIEDAAATIERHCDILNECRRAYAGVGHHCAPEATQLP